MRIASTCLALLCCCSPLLAQEAGKLRHGGSEVFRFALHQKGLKPVTSTDEAFVDPVVTIIVILGDTSNLTDLIDPENANLAWFIDRGGAVLIATDKSTMPSLHQPDSKFHEQFGFNVTGKILVADDQVCYQKNSTRPNIRPNPPPLVIPPSPYDIFKPADGGLAIATDRPSELYLEPLGNLYQYSRLATYPESIRFQIRGDRIAPLDNLFAFSLQRKPRGKVPNRGRMLVMADQSVFANGMMGFDKDETQEKGYRLDNGNWEFTNRTIDWLQAGSEKPRSKCLFIENGEIVDHFAIAVPPPIKPPIPKISPEKIANILLKAANGKVEELQQNNYFNRTLERLLGLPRILRIFLLVATVLFAYFAFRRLMWAYRTVRNSTTMTAGVLAGLLPRGTLFRQRTSAQLDSGNLYEAARQRIRSRFELLGGRPGPSGETPPILTASDLNDSAFLFHSIKWLWSIGYGDSPFAVRPADWDRVNHALETACLRASRGDWSFGVEAS